MEIAIVIGIVHNAISGETTRLNYWIQAFGQRWLKILINIWIGSKLKIIDWIVILLSFLCFRGKESDFSNGISDQCFFFISDNHWRLGIIEKPAEFMEGNM